MTYQPSPDLDASVIAAAQAGDERAHAAIYAHYANRLFTLIYRLVPRRAQAEDLLQEVFVDVLRSVKTFAGAGSFGGWLRSIAVNKCLSHLRSPWRRRMLWLGDELQADNRNSFVVPPLDGAFAAQRDMETALQRLSPIARSVVWLHDVEGYTHGEIGSFFGRTASFSKSQLARAHERLRELLTAGEAVDSSYSEVLPCAPAAQSASINS